MTVNVKSIKLVITRSLSTTLGLQTQTGVGITGCAVNKNRSQSSVNNTETLSFNTISFAVDNIRVNGIGTNNVTVFVTTINNFVGGGR